jgi:hypothetical protein
VAVQVLGDELRRERQERDGQQQQQVEEEQRAVGARHRLHAVVVVDPDDPDREEARRVRQVRRPEVEQRVAEAAPRRGGDADLEHEQRRGDREDAVAESLEPGRPGLVHRR